MSFKFKTSLYSLAITVFISIAFLFTDITKIKANIVPTLLIAFITYVLTYITLELYDYTKVLNENKKYTQFFEKFDNEGIMDYFSEYSSVDIKSSLKDSRKLSLVEIYSTRNIKDNYDTLKEFLSNKEHSLDLVVLNPNTTSNEYKYLSNKFSYPEDKIASQIIELVNDLKNLKRDLGYNCGKINVYYSKFIPQYSMIMFDNVIYVTFYKTSPGRSTKIPVFKIYSKPTSTFYDFLKNDFHAIISHNSIQKEVI